jgi:hypothetical protein
VIEPPQRRVWHTSLAVRRNGAEGRKIKAVAKKSGNIDEPQSRGHQSPLRTMTMFFAGEPTSTGAGLTGPYLKQPSSNRKQIELTLLG